ncbi:hypothetical protein KVR01_012190 [Diaporthe batatas]|uniref:uncharacterized protein n=1 Tax=Diaporthe batatas TaxID=748121 RepID=UPI001D05832C|nr:uncharacterized protein KVR01_012190 [Diaporthe batatas]KAG8157918.1 hypothetical protein KVR01_012190 [Diaporthe batatas]
MTLITQQSLAIAALVGLANGFGLDQTCLDIKGNISSSSDIIISPLDARFAIDIDHWFASSSQKPACVFEPGTPEDVSIAIDIIAQSQTPFALKSGGHTSNPGHSSTPGVHISFARMKQVKLSEDKSSVELGMGLIWAEAYQALSKEGVNVVGGRLSGPGVGGLTLGGGYSWKTNQFGLTCDTVKTYNLVLPNGTITTASASTNTDLFFALKGGLNRFGIVTSIVYETHPQPPLIYGGQRIYTADKADALIKATEIFTRTVTDPKAQVILTLEGLPAVGLIPYVLFFYDGPDPGASFAMFDGILPVNSGTIKQPFSTFVGAQATQLLQSSRGTSHTVSVSAFTVELLEVVKKEVQSLTAQQLLHGGSLVSGGVDPFLDYGRYATDSAFPHADSPLPISIYCAWGSSTEDEFWINAVKQSVANIKQAAVQAGIFKESFTPYTNYAIGDTTAEELYGTTNLARLRSVKATIDPHDVMELAGGFSLK